MSDEAADTLWVAFLRGMNLGGRRLSNGELQVAAERCGCRDVRPFQASGNLVVVDERPEEAVLTAMQEGLEATLGYPVPVHLRGADEVRAIAAATPFSQAETAASSGKPQVIFLRATPSPDTVGAIETLIPDNDLVVPAGRQIHWLPAQGLADNGLDLRRLDALTGGTTVRTHGTVQRLASKFL